MRSVLLPIVSFIAFGFGSLPGVEYNGLIVIGVFDKDPQIHKEQNRTGIYLFTIEM